MSLSSLVSAADYRPDEPLVVGVARRDAPPVLLAQGTTAAGDPVTTTTLVYAASLSKQLTAACAALLVEDGVLDVDAPLSRWLPELPAWASDVRLRHLVHHTAGLPDDRDIDAGHTTAGVLRALAHFPSLPRRPGTAYAYSNAGYVCLAVAVERCAGRPLPAFARERLFAPLRMTRTRYWPGPSPAPDGPGSVAPVAGPAPLSLGDGGVWTTLTDLLCWGQALNADEPGIARLVQTPGRLDDGTPLDYAWGVGVREHAGHRVYRHGGGWPGLRALHARVPAPGLTLALVALDDRTERRVTLMDGLLDAYLSSPSSSPIIR